jgi:hypothetical protein
MSPRTALLGLIGVLGLVGQTAAAPPGDSLLDERQSSPTVRERAEKPSGGDVPGHAALTPRSGAWLILTGIVWDVVLDRFTIPLGTAEVLERDFECDA